uniref:RNA-directed RNA polymerase L n=2 Tax=Guanarito mammarenavirus (isolate Human/Venezuela/NH-95551/1990) TaxID=3052307 RepID=A0A1U8ZSC2_GTOVV|nr:RNA-directed RNA polymerase L [Mammarenavirus guanaritoense]
MDEKVFVLKDFIRRQVPDIPELSYQKEALLSQVEVPMVLTEGFKLLSCLVEIESCRKNSCECNFEQKFVDTILSENGVVAPTLPKVIPDGYRFFNKTLILLETFVRVNPEEFEKKWKTDMAKLLSLKEDIHRTGITLVPVVDGRGNYNTDLLPDWATERFRWLLIDLLRESRGAPTMEIEDQEYHRLIHSLSKTSNQSLGFENIECLKRVHLNYEERLNEQLLKDIVGEVRESKIREELIKLKTWYREEIYRKGLGNFVQTDRKSLLQTLVLSSAHSDSLAPECPMCCSKILDLCYQLSMRIADQTSLENNFDEPLLPTTQIEKVYLSLLSACNKIKGKKVFNTRRNTLLFLDLIILNFVAHVYKTQPSEMETLRKAGLIIGEMLLLSNDRVLDILVARRLLLKKVESCCNWLDRCRHLLRKEEPVLWDCVSEFTNVPDFELLLSLAEELCSEKPVMHYKPPSSLIGDCAHKDLMSMSDGEFESLFKCLSHISLSLVNSMKTSFSSRLLVNEKDYKRYYGTVRLKECYVQRFFLREGLYGLLFYQKTGEKSRCYSLYLSDKGNLVELGSFYSDPKRFFLPIFSEFVLLATCAEMLSWLEFDEKLADAVTPLLKILVLSILSSPTKRSQTFLQGLRYFIMAYVNQAHHVQLMSKLAVECKSASDVLIQRLSVKIVDMVLTGGSDPDMHMTRKFKFVLNVSYLCHLITKETPDRLTDQIKCFEKFMEPKLEFGSLIVNPSLNGFLSKEQEDAMIKGVEKFFSKELLTVEDLKRPGVSRELLSYCVSLFNKGRLRVNGTLGTDPYRPSFTSTALDLSSNKSVVIPKLNEVGEIVSEYDKQKLVSTCITSMAERFKTKGRYNLDPDTIDFLIMRNLTNLLSARKLDSSKKEELSLLYEHLSEDVMKAFEEIKYEVEITLSKMRLSRELECGHKKPCTLEGVWAPFNVLKVIRSETSVHEIRDFDPDLLGEDVYEKLCVAVYDSPLRPTFFLEKPLDICPLELLLKNLTTKSYEDDEFFDCFKYILIQAGFDQRLGAYEHKNRSRLGLSEEAFRLKEDVRVSNRQSNSEAIADRLDKSFFTSAALRNLCFYSEESPTEYTCISPNVGNLKFGLSYKEQVGSNRELYVGDLNTKMMTRLVEDFTEAVANSMNYTCLNSEKEFERAICDMKMAVNNGDLCCSLDHSKWGPFMSPALFHAFFGALKFKISKTGEQVDLGPVLNVLKWHLHKAVEVPISVAEAYCTGMLKRRLGLMSLSCQSVCEEFFHQKLLLEEGVPSHIMSVLDMGQGILHNSSDLYGLITEQFINYCLDFLFDVIPVSYTSSDDQITTFKLPTMSLSEDGLDGFDWLELLCFHDFLSSKFNKFVSPKSVSGTFVAEFKSRFFVMGEETPLLTKFVSAALHNVKCKTPTQLAETIDTICDQCVANGVGIEIVTKISERVNRLIRYSGYPQTPFLAVEKQDVKDWTDGSRGYRLQRNIEHYLQGSEQLEFVRKCAKKVLLKIKKGQVFEEYLVQLIGKDGDDALKGFLSYAGCESDEIKDVLKYRWLNLSANGDLRLVLRTKLMSTRRVLEREQIPTLIKTLQSKLSKNFTKGVKKILAESINKSAFQSSVASGFIGFCKSMGSKCVRDGSGGFMYIREVLNKQRVCPCEICAKNPGIIFCSDALTSIPEFSRSILWDYFSLVLTNACELGEWVFSSVQPPKVPILLNNPNLFWAVKPRGTRLIEDQLGLGHVLQSVRRSYPKVFEEHLVPFMNDLQVSRTTDFTRLRYLDVCVALDMMNENLGIVSHLLKAKDNSIYIVKQSECAVAHIRQVEYVNQELGLSPQQICSNFKIQLVFSSMINPLVITTSVLKSFFWFNEVLSLEDESQIDVGELTDFTILIKKYNLNRAMMLDDLTMGYVVSTISEPTIHLVSLKRISNSIVGNQDSEVLHGEQVEGMYSIVLHIQLEHKRHSTKYHLSRTVVYSYTVECETNITDIEKEPSLATVKNVVLRASGSIEGHQFLDGVNLVASQPIFTGKKVINLSELLADSEITETCKEGDVVGSILLSFGTFYEHIDDRHAYEIVGPECSDSPLVLDGGSILADGKKLSSIKVELTGDVILKALGALESEKEVQSLLTGLWPFIRINNLKVKMAQEDFLLMYEMHRESLLKSLEVFSEWCEFVDFSVCYSKSLRDLVISDSSGSLRLKGITCKPINLSNSVTEIE